MMGKFPGLPKMYMSLVDVRDVALAHLRALTGPANKRYALSTDTVKFNQIGVCLHNTFGQYGYKIC